MKSGAQCHPYGWACPFTTAVEGLRRYKFNADADRISFTTTVLKEFPSRTHHTQKYNGFRSPL